MTNKQTAEQQIKIDLNKIWNPHPDLLETYRSANAEHLFTDLEALRPQYKNEERLFKIQSLSKSPIEHHLGSVYRKAVGSKEYVLFFNHMKCLDFYHSPVDHTRFLGRWEKPEIIRRFTIPNSIRSDVSKVEAEESPPEVNGSQVIYDYEFNALKWQLAQWYEKDHIITDETHFYYWDNDGVKNPVRSFDEFLNMSGTDLILLAKSGKKLSGVFRAEERAQMLESLRVQIKEEMKTAGFFKTT